MTNIVCFGTTLKIFRIYQVFPAVGRELNPGIPFFLKFVLICLLASVVIVGSFKHFIYSLKNQKHNYIYKDMSSVLSMLTGYSFIVLFHYNFGSAVKLFTFLSDFEAFGKPPNFEARNQQLNKLSKYHYIYISSMSLAFAAFADIFVSNQCRRDDESFDPNDTCGLAFNFSTFPMKQIYATLRVFSAMYVYAIAGMVTWSIVEMVEHIAVRIDHVKLLFSTALSKSDPRKMENNFRFAAKYHSHILQLEKYLNQCFSLAMFSMMLLGAPILGCAAFGYMETASKSSLVMVSSWFTALSLVSIAGQRLINENMTIADEIYNSKWYNAGLSLRKDVLIVLMRCQKPMKLRAAAFGVMNHAMIVTVCRAAYSYINILGAAS